MLNIVPIRTSVEIAAIINNGQQTLAQLGVQICQEEMQGIDNQNTIHQDKIFRLLLIDIILFNILDEFGNILNYYQAKVNEAKFNKILTGLHQLCNGFGGPSIPLLLARNTSISFVPIQVPTGGFGSGVMHHVDDSYNISTNLFPTVGSASDGSVQRGDMYEIVVGGSPQGYDLYPGATIMAKRDNPGQTLSNWRIWD